MGHRSLLFRSLLSQQRRQTRKHTPTSRQGLGPDLGQPTCAVATTESTPGEILDRQSQGPTSWIAGSQGPTSWAAGSQGRRIAGSHIVDCRIAGSQDRRVLHRGLQDRKGINKCPPKSLCLVCGLRQHIRRQRKNATSRAQRAALRALFILLQVKTFK